MYILRNSEAIGKVNQTKLAEKIGVDISTISRIFNKKQRCSKIMAYSITKTINSEAEIEDFFVRV